MRSLAALALFLVACQGEVAIVQTDSETVDTDVDTELPAPVPPALDGAANSSGGGSGTSENYQINVVIGDPMPVVDTTSESHQLTVGVGTFVRERRAADQ